MGFEIIKKRQPIYIIIVTFVTASISLMIIHGISTSHSSSSDNIIPSDKFDPISHPNRDILKDIPQPLKSSIVQPQSNNDELIQAALNCQISGCNHELCIDANQTDPLPDNLSTCSRTEASKCYIGATCAVQSGGSCGWTTTPTITKCIADSNFATQTMRVIQIKFITETSYMPYDINVISSELRADIKAGSAFHKFDNSAAKPVLDVEVVEDITVNHAREDVDGTLFSSYYKMIQEMGLCQKIRDEKIDQIWMWVDPADSTAPGLEFLISSKYALNLRNNGDFIYPPFCNTNPSFVVMGFDYTRSSEEALHSFGHYLEAMLDQYETRDLVHLYFGEYDNLINGRYACGTVHYPPNGEVDYDYFNTTAKPTMCENWNPQGTGELQSYNCTRWGCSESGYLIWWMQNMPSFNNTLTYQGKTLPPWLDFVVDMDTKIQKYYQNTNYFIDSAQITANNIDYNTNCGCQGTDQNHNPVSRGCFGTVIGVDLLCYQCFKTQFKPVPDIICDN